MKKTIKPHKGGRDVRVFARLTTQERARLQAQLEREGMSLADWIVQQVEKEEQRQLNN